MLRTVSGGLDTDGPGPGFATRPGDDLEHERILAAVHAAMFGRAPPSIGHYRLERLLGAGGMGEVFLAWDPSLRRRVAVKVLRPTLADTELLEREALALARLSHPHVVQVHAFGRHDGRAYVVMEYVEGPTLREYVVRERPRWSEVVALLRCAAEGLAAAHRVGVIHRDFKPDNVLVGEDRRVRVVDFGLALSSEAPDDGQARRAGTPRYMAPEQLAGDPVDARADQFALCVSLAELLGAEQPRRPQTGQPAWVWRAIARGLAEDPAQRWPDMRSLIDALDVGRRRRRWAIITAPIAAVMLALGLRWTVATPPIDPCAGLEAELVGLWTHERRTALADRLSASDEMLGPTTARTATQALDEWAETWLSAREQGCRARHRGALSEPTAARREACLLDQRRRVEALIAQLETADRRTFAHARELIAALPAPLACEHDNALRLGVEPPDPAIAAEVEQLRTMLARAAARRLAGHAESNFAVLDELQPRVDALAYAPLTAELSSERAANEFLAGSPNRGVELLEQAARMAYRSGDDRLAARLWTELSTHAVSEVHEPERGAAYLTQARDAWTRVGPDDDARASLAFAAGALALERGDLERAQRELDEALRLQAHLDDQGLRPFVLERLALLAEQRGQGVNGLAHRREAVAAALAWFGPLHPRTIGMRVNLGLALVETGDYARARAALDEAFAGWARGDGQARRELADASLVLASLQLAEADPDAALHAAERAAKLYAELTPEDHLTRAEADNAIATIQHVRGQYEAALAAYDRAAEHLEHVSDDDAILRRALPVNRGACLLALDRLDEAAAAFASAIDVASGPIPIAAWLGLAEIELRRSQPRPALAWLDRAVLDADARAIDRAEWQALRALASLRLGAAPQLDALADALAGLDASDREILQRDLDQWRATPSERAALHLAPSPNKDQP